MRKTFSTYVCIFLVLQLIVSGLILIPQSGWAQQERKQGFLVKMQAVTIHENHEWGDGEFHLLLYVGPNSVLLSYPGSGLDDAGDERYPNNAAALIVIPVGGEIRLQTVGKEGDEGPPLPNLPYDELNNIPYVEYYDKIKNAVNSLLSSINPDDGIGFVAKQYGPWNNYGIGHHDDRSQCNGIDADSCGDFTLSYDIIPVPPMGLFGFPFTNLAASDFVANSLDLEVNKTTSVLPKELWTTVESKLSNATANISQNLTSDIGKEGKDSVFRDLGIAQEIMSDLRNELNNTAMNQTINIVTSMNSTATININDLIKKIEDARQKFSDGALKEALDALQGAIKSIIKQPTASALSATSLSTLSASSSNVTSTTKANSNLTK
jgi:hypothetical protein